MPFTLSHPAAVLPLRRTGLPFAALVCGSMAPDLHMVVPGLSDTATHAWTGVPTIDVALGCALTVLWVVVLGPTARAAAPQWVRTRLHDEPVYRRREWLLGLVAVAVGSATHVGWDSFTHQAMWGGRHVPWLYEIHHGRPGYEWSQYVSSVVGLLVVGVYLLLRLRGRTPRPAPKAERAEAARWALLGPVVVAVLLGMAVAALMLTRSWIGYDYVLGSAARVVLVVASLGAGAGAVLWRLGERFELSA